MKPYLLSLDLLALKPSCPFHKRQFHVSNWKSISILDSAENNVLRTYALSSAFVQKVFLDTEYALDLFPGLTDLYTIIGRIESSDSVESVEGQANEENDDTEFLSSSTKASIGAGRW